jgi:hypothetical protein
MSSGLDVVEPQRVIAPTTAARWHRDRWFFSGMALAAAVTVFVGFAPTYYLKGAFGAPTLPTVLHVHGLLFTTWIVLFVVQTGLVATKRTHVHRRLGIAGAVLAALMPVAGLAAALDSLGRGFTPPGGPPPHVFFVVPFFDLIVFATLCGTGLYFRRRSDTHKRLMLLATIGLLTAAIARWPGVGGGIPVFFALTDLFVVACFVYDRATRGRVHPAFLWGGLLLVASQPLRLAIGGTGAWLAFAKWIAG